MLSKDRPFDTNRRKKPGIEALQFKECKGGFIAHSKHFTYKVKHVRRPYLGRFMIPFIQI